MLLKQTIQNTPFNKWLLGDRENKLLLWFSLAITIISFTWLKILYPYPNFMPPDSNSYIEAAQSNQFINIWAIGYSKFLRLVSCFSNSHFFLTTIQYLLLQFSLLYFMFSIRYLLNPGKITFRLLIAFSITNPLLPHIANFISSDCLFTALSLVWFTQLLWFIYHPNKKILIVHSVTLLLAFTVRYNAVMYPIISIIVILFFTNLSRLQKLTNFCLIGLPILVFISSTQLEYYKRTGTTQFSAFGGWQIAANALYGYAHSIPNDPLKVPFEFRVLHEYVNQHMDSLHNLTIRPDNEVAIYYLWGLKSPLRKYMIHKMVKENTKDYFSGWAKVAPLYSRYGRYLILKHPIPFLKYYIWPNFKKYYTPPTKFMGFYNRGMENVDPKVASWFGWKNNKINTNTESKRIWIAETFTLIMALVNIVFILSLSFFLLSKEIKQERNLSRQIFTYALIVWSFNLVFSVFAAPIELRYQLFPFFITFCFMWLSLSYIVRISFSRPKNIVTSANLPPIFRNQLHSDL
jgi:hypothetical protein